MRAYLEDVTSAEFCEEGRHGLVRRVYLAAEFLKARRVQDRIGLRVRLDDIQHPVPNVRLLVLDAIDDSLESAVRRLLVLLREITEHPDRGVDRV